LVLLNLIKYKEIKVIKCTVRDARDARTCNYFVTCASCILSRGVVFTTWVSWLQRNAARDSTFSENQFAPIRLGLQYEAAIVMEQLSLCIFIGMSASLLLFRLRREWNRMITHVFLSEENYGLIFPFTQFR